MTCLGQESETPEPDPSLLLTPLQGVVFRVCFAALASSAAQPVFRRSLAEAVLVAVCICSLAFCLIRGIRMWYFQQLFTALVQYHVSDSANPIRVEAK